MKVKVKLLTSIAGVADPDHAKLDAKYARLRAIGATQKTISGNPRSQASIEAEVAEEKARDHYDAKPIGFKNDWGFKQGEEAMVPEELGNKWSEAGICILLVEPAGKKAA